MGRVLRIAAVQPNAEACSSERAFCNKVKRLTQIAADSGATVVVFPEGLNFWLTYAS
jgi:predicted amidohydrolase